MSSYHEYNNICTCAVVDGDSDISVVNARGSGGDTQSRSFISGGGDISIIIIRGNGGGKWSRSFIILNRNIEWQLIAIII